MEVSMTWQENGDL